MDKESIRDRLSVIERENDVRVLLASESGSRAWGFESPDSDYDVRGIYVRPVEWYLSINVENKRDVIEVSEGELDIALWDLRKALKLGAKSNPALFEWFHSPIGYRATRESIDLIRVLNPFYSPRRAAYHYRQMAKNNFDRYLQGSRVKIKKFLYVARPVLALHWIETRWNNAWVPPVYYDALLHNSHQHGYASDGIRWELENLVQRKRDGDELGEADNNWILFDWLREQLFYAEDLPDKLPDSDADAESLNKFFRSVVNG